MKTITLLSILLLALATTGQSAGTLYSFKVPRDGATSNGVPIGLTNATAPVLTPASGAVPLDVAVVSVGNMVFVTTNGATPTTNLTPYASGTLFIVTSSNDPLRAIAWTNSDGRLPSSVTSAYYSNSVAPSGDFTLTASNTTTTGHNDIGGTRYVGVSDTTRYQWTLVTIPSGANIAKFSLLMGIGLGTPTGYLTGLVHSVSGSTPTSTQLGISTAVAASSLAALGTSNWIDFTLTSPVSTTEPVTLALGVTRDATAFGDYPMVWSPDPFLATGVWQTTNTTEFIDSASRQLNFRTYSSP